MVALALYLLSGQTGSQKGEVFKELTGVEKPEELLH